MDRRLKSIQYWRGAAAMMVVVAHSFAHPLADSPVSSWIAGRFGVTLFFTISGFIMVAVTGADRFDPIDFLKNRIVRVVPLYWLVTLTAAAASLMIPSAFHKTVFSVSHLFQSLFFIPALRPGNPGMIEPFVKLGWTLNYEMFFYVIFSCLFFLRSRSRVALIVFLFGSLVAYGQLYAPTETLARFYTSYDLMGFSAGATLALAYQENLLKDLSRWVGGTFLAIGLVIVVVVFVETETKFPSLFGQFCLVTVSILFLSGGLVLERANAVPANASLLLVGNASYSLYLVHMFVVGTVVVGSHRLWGTQVTTFHYLAVVALAVFASLLAGIVTYLYIESSMLEALRSRKRRALKPGAALP